MVAKRKSAEPLVAELDAWIGGFRPGKRKSGVLTSGAYEVELTVHVRPRQADPTDVTRWHQEAIDLCKREPWRIDRCGASTTKKMTFSRSNRSCERACTHVIVDRISSIFDKQQTTVYRFACGQHADQQRDGVLAVFPFLSFELDQLRKLLRARQGG